MASGKPRDGPKYYLVYCYYDSTGIVKMRGAKHKLAFQSPNEAFCFLQGQIALQEKTRRTECNPRLYCNTKLFLLRADKVDPRRAMRLAKTDMEEFRRHVVRQYMVYYVNQKLCIRRRVA